MAEITIEIIETITQGPTVLNFGLPPSYTVAQTLRALNSVFSACMEDIRHHNGLTEDASVFGFLRDNPNASLVLMKDVLRDREVTCG